MKACTKWVFSLVVNLILESLSYHEAHWGEERKRALVAAENLLFFKPKIRRMEMVGLAWLEQHSASYVRYATSYTKIYCIFSVFLAVYSVEECKFLK